MAAATAMAVLGASVAQATTIKVYGTSDVTDSSMLSGLIAPGFSSFSGGTTINYIAQGSGAAIVSAENPANNADDLVVHAPSLEAPFVSGGFSYDTGCTPPGCLGRSIFYNDYVIVGPTADPAGAATQANNAAGAFDKIGTAGAAGTATFMSRDDNSGTNVEEQTIWGLTTTTTKQLAHNRPAGNTTRYTPWSGTGTSFPAWYVANGLLQGANLRATDACTGHVGCYTIVDRGTWQYEKSLSHTTHLKIVAQLNAAASPGGASLLTNPFHAYSVNSSTQKTAATQFLDYLTSKDFQKTDLPGYLVGGSPPATADAYAAVTGVSIPTHAAANSTITISATLKYPPPVATNISGMPVTLESAPAATGPWTTVTQAGLTNPANTNASGFVSFSPKVGSSNIWYRFNMGTYSDTANATRFSPNQNSSLGAAQGKVLVP